MSANSVSAEVIEGHAEEIGSAVVPAHAATATLFRTDDPVTVLARATATANALKGVLDKQGLTSDIKGRKHVKIEGWQTVGAMLGVTPVCDWTRPVSEPAKGWEARVEARTMDGRVIGSAEAMCLRSEGTWANRDEYAIRSMAQTRATSKALASVLRFIVTLAGYDGTPAEEMQGDSGGAPQATARQRKPSERPITNAQKGKINALMAEAGLAPEEASAVRVWWCSKANCSQYDRLPSRSASELIDRLDDAGTGAQGILDELGDAATKGHEAAEKIVARMEEASGA